MPVTTTSIARAHPRAALLVGLLIGTLPACTQAPREPQPRVVAQFSGVVDPQKGTLTLTLARTSTGKAGEVHAAVATIPTVQDGTPGSGPADTVELVTEAIRYDQAGCGRPNSFCADVTVRSFFTSNELHNVYVEITGMAPAVGNHGFWNTADPTGAQPGAGAVTSANGGLWAYPALLDATRGAFTSNQAPGANAATRTWYFDNILNTAYTFSGRVMADVVPALTQFGQTANCGGVATELWRGANCGECGRTNGSDCIYSVVRGASQATSWLNFKPICSTGRTACDTADAMAFSCKSLQTDRANCGVCGRACGNGEVCSGGACVADTAAGTCLVGNWCGPASGGVCCPDGTTCSGASARCLLSDASGVAVGSAQACATTATTSRIPYQQYSGLPPKVANNLVCWGKSWAGAGFAISSSFLSGVPAPDDHLGYPFSNPGSGGTATYAIFNAADTGNTATWGWGTLVWSANYADGQPLYGSPELSVGGSHMCRGGSPFVGCYGANSLGQLGHGTTVDSGSPFLLVLGVGGVAGDGSRLVASNVSAGGDTTCAVLEAPFAGYGTGQTAGTVACWGDNTSGKAGGPVTGVPNYLVPHLVLLDDGVTPLSSVARLSVGASHVVALLSTGDLVFWGRNARGQFGNGTTADGNRLTAVPVSVLPATPVAVSAGQDFTCYRDAPGQVWCAGANDRGQLGDGSTTERHTFVQVAGLTGATSVSAGGVPKTGNTAYGGACALVPPGVYCWGDNTYGQVGVGTDGSTNAFYTTPQRVEMTRVP